MIIACTLEIPEPKFRGGDPVILDENGHPFHKRVGHIQGRYATLNLHIYENGRSSFFNPVWIYLVEFGPFGAFDCLEDKLISFEGGG